MKRLLIYNYWLMIVAWCMFLNNNTLMAILLGLGACTVLVFIKRRINYWRMSFLSVISYVIISLILSITNIPYFFRKLYIFLAVICLNCALTSERLYLFKSKYLKPFLVAMLFCVAVLSIIAIILPNSLYTIFTKSSLLIMIGLIFLPYLLSLSFFVCYKEIKYYLKSNKYTLMQKIKETAY